MRVALYLRRSTTDQQPDSLAAQEELLRRFASVHRHEVTAVFSDSASGRRVERRPEFQKMITTVKTGAPPFDAILVRDVSRWSRAENLDESAFYEWLCRARGVDVIYVEDNLGPEGTAYGQLMKSLKRYMAAEFSRERGPAVRRSYARVIELGFWPMGSCPYGMKRVRCDLQGNIIAELLPGERKALSTERVKLAPGGPEELSIVQRIFREYSDGRSLEEIAAQLNADGVPSPRRTRWKAPGLGYMLANEAYAGTIVYRVPNDADQLGEPSAWSEGIREIRRTNAHPAIVGSDLWNNVQQRLRKQSWHRSLADLSVEFAKHRESWGHPTTHATADATAARRGYGAPDGVAIATNIDDATAALRTKLEATFHVVPFEGGLLVDHLLHVRFLASLPHSRFGQLHWQFEFTGEEREDVFIGLGFSPPEPVEHVETYLFRSRGGRARRTVQPLLGASSRQNCKRILSFDEIVESLNHSIRYRSTSAERVFLATVRTRERLNMGEIAKELHWSYDAVRTLYRKLELRGEPMPPLSNGVGVKRIAVTCPHCLGVRQLTVKAVLTLKTEVCFECLHRPPVITRNRLVAECPSCGARRLFRPCDVKSRRDGVNSLCGRCQRLQNCSAGNLKRRATP